MKVLSLLVVLCFLSATFGTQCPFHPQFWCDTPEMAKQCGVSYLAVCL